MLQKLFSKWSVKGDLQVDVSQDHHLDACSHLNHLHIVGARTYEWFRDSTRLDNSQSQYDFTLDDVGSMISARVSDGKRTSTISIGPITVDKVLSRSFQSRFPVTLERCLVLLDGSIVGESKSINRMGTMHINQGLILHFDANDIVVTLNQAHSLSSDLKLSLDANSTDYLEILKIVKLLTGIQISKFHQVQLYFTASPLQSKHMLLAFKMHLYRNTVAHQHLLKQLECPNSENIDNSVLIANLKEGLYTAQKTISTLQKEKLQFTNKIKNMEEEMHQIIDSYQAILNENNLTQQYSSMKQSLGKITGKQSMVADSLQQENAQLKQKIQQLQSIQLPEPQNYSAFSRDALIKKVQDLELNLNKAKRLNEILNSSLGAHDQQYSPSQIESYTKRILELEGQCELVTEYRQQIIEQKQLIQELRKKKCQQNDGYVRELEQEIDYLRNQTSTYHNDSRSEMSAVNSECEIEQLVEQNHKLQQMCSVWQRKNDSLLKEIQLLSKNPAANNSNFLEQTKKIKELSQQIHLLEQENFKLKDQSRRSSRTNTETSGLSPLLRQSSRSTHGIFDDLPPQPKLKLTPKPRVSII